MTLKDVAKFIFSNIICRYGLLNELISKEGSNFKKEWQTGLRNVKSNTISPSLTEPKQMEKLRKWLKTTRIGSTSYLLLYGTYNFVSHFNRSNMILPSI